MNMEYRDKKYKKRYIGYTLRLSIESMNKLHYIADYNERPVSYELRPLIAGFIAEFEKKHGEIRFPPGSAEGRENRKHR